MVSVCKTVSGPTGNSIGPVLSTRKKILINFGFMKPKCDFRGVNNKSTKNK